MFLFARLLSAGVQVLFALFVSNGVIIFWALVGPFCVYLNFFLGFCVVTFTY